MATPIINKTWSPLAAGYCFTTYNQFGKDILDHSTLSLSGNFSLVMTQPVAPTGTDTQYLWFNTTDQRIYQFRLGKWISKHPSAASGSERRLWVGIEADIWSYDGGDGNNASIGETWGAMWDVDTTFAARFPIGVGSLPSTTAITVNATGGEETHLLTTDELPEHVHPAGENKTFLINTTAGGTDTASGGVYPQISAKLTTTDVNVTDGLAHNNLPPYIGVYFIKRTARQYYAISI